MIASFGLYLINMEVDLTVECGLAEFVHLAPVKVEEVELIPQKVAHLEVC